ncbi:phage tail assembly chaperone [Paenibacillus flagellatus]|uniref:Phage portal protein n=1 Tax=Paenibacillus flagellatus TaxID=2211139 RepID=A0A2V5KBS9_9BACL|nr:phage portal protein [Paenibacillus flagellatus]PYI57021.1 phage portal protein [Paenibacillus flagellatus]
MSELSAFFAQNVSTEIVESFVVSERFKDKDGKPIEWKLRAVTQDESEAIRKACTRVKKGPGGSSIQEIDQGEFIAKMAAASVQFPNLKDTALQDSYGVRGAEVLLRKMLLAGEYAALLTKTQELSGFDRDINEDIEAAKN